MAESEGIIVAMTLRNIPPGMPHSRCYQILQEHIDNFTFTSTSGDLTFTAHVEGIGQLAAVER